MQVLKNLSVLMLVALLSGSAGSLDLKKAEGDYPCGTVLTEHEGVLQYKPFETAALNERCVWILRVPEASGYNITLYNLAYGGTFDNNALHITGLNRGDHVTKETVPTYIDTNYYINGSVAILTYYSSTYRVGRGFSLFWTTDRRNPSNNVSLNSTTQIRSDLAVNISHPNTTTGLDRYDNNELSTFIFTPEFSNNKTLHRNEIQFLQLELEGVTCNDFIDIFTFNPEYAHTGWDTYGRFCGADTDVTFTATDMVLLVFHSDGSHNYDGFELKYRRVNV